MGALQAYAIIVEKLGGPLGYGPQTAKGANGNVLTRFTYTLDDTGRRVRLEEASGRITEWQYDDLYRLTQETITDPVNGNRTASYTYDKVGNRLTETVNGTTTSYSYDANDRMTQKGGTSYSYDANGNTVSRNDGTELVTYSYDARNKLIEAVTASQTIHYGYDIEGIRTEKSAGGTTTNYAVDHNRRYAQVLAERENGSLARTYTYGEDLLSQKVPSGDASYYLYDGRGSTRALADADGNVTDTYAYEAFGELTSSSGSTLNSYRFTGEQYDASLSHYYLRARYYDQAIGRFTQDDSWKGRMKDPGTLNKYAYVMGDPVNTVDPSGNVGIAQQMAAVSIQGILAEQASPTNSLRDKFSQIHIRLGYTEVEFNQFHTFVIVDNLMTAENYITRAGPTKSVARVSSSAPAGSSSAASGSGGGQTLGGSGFGHIQAQHGRWTENLDFDKPSNTIITQHVGTVDRPYDVVVKSMIKYGNKINARKIPYWPSGPNSNSYAFSYVETLNFDRPEPVLSAPGWKHQL